MLRIKQWNLKFLLSLTKMRKRNFIVGILWNKSIQRTEYCKDANFIKYFWCRNDFPVDYDTIVHSLLSKYNSFNVVQIGIILYSFYIYQFIDTKIYYIYRTPFNFCCRWALHANLPTWRSFAKVYQLTRATGALRK